MSTSRIHCSSCGTESKLFFQSIDYNRKITRVVFNHYRCPKCKLLFISPIPENLGDYYPQAYYSVPKSTHFLDDAAIHEEYKIEILQQYVTQGRLLEIGPSLGSFAYLAKQKGYQTETIEMDERCSKFLNEVAGIPTVNSGDTCGALKSLKPFDVIALWHVIEHLPNPWETLEAIRDKLNPDGILILAAPNPAAFQFRVLGRYWPHVDSPRHLMLIPSELLINKMASLGMKLELNTTTDQGGLGWNIFGWEYFFSNFTTSPRMKWILKFFGRVVAKIFRPIEKIEGKGCAYTMVFRKGAST